MAHACEHAVETRSPIDKAARAGHTLFPADSRRRPVAGVSVLGTLPPAAEPAAMAMRQK